MVRAEDEPHEVGHHQPDEADQPGEGDARRHRDRREHDGNPLHRLHPHAEVERLRLPQQERVKRAGEKAEQQRRHADQGKHDRQLRPARAGQAAQRPEGDVAHLPVIRHEDQQAGQRARERVDRDPGEQKRRDRGDAAHRAEPRHEQCRAEPAREGRGRQQPQAEQPGRHAEQAAAEHDRRDGGECRAGRDADQPRIGERVAEQPLHRRPGGAQPGADQRRHQHARGAHHAEHGGIPRVLGRQRRDAERIGQRGQQPRGGDARRPKQDAGEHRAEQQHDAKRQQGEAAVRAGSGRGEAHAHVQARAGSSGNTAVGCSRRARSRRAWAARGPKPSV